MARSRAQLNDYRAKRDFAATPEPAAYAPEAAADTPEATEAHPAASTASRDAAERACRFVIHEHHARRLHWDLRLERDGVLASWALPKGLPESPGENHFAAATEDHPLEYLDFEATIPRGQYGAGKIAIWDRGTFDTLKWEPRKIEVALHGERVNARYALFRIGGEDAPGDWMVHRMDPPADDAREPMPQRIVPMLAHAGELPADDERWAFELKWDGVRALVYSSPGELRVESRNLNDVTSSYPELAGVGAALGSHSAILDGEIVALDSDGRASFAALQRRMHVSSKDEARRLARDTPVTLVVFDLLWLDGHALMQLPYVERRRRLRELNLAGEALRVPDNVIGQGAALLAAAAERDLEGVMAKRLSSTYRPGQRSRDWVKVKTSARQEFVVGGWMPGKGKRHGSVGALLLGVNERDGTLRYVGRVGSGFSDAELERLSALLAPLERERSPFTSGERPPRGAVFCEPRLVAEVRFAWWTDAGNLRAATYQGLREDKPPGQVVREHAPADARRVRLTNLDKVMYPRTGFTKGDLIDYYTAIAPVLLGHLTDRALTVTRWPDGVEGKSFFQKQAPAHRPEWVRTARVPNASTPRGAAKQIDYVLARDVPTLEWLANLAAIELHVPLAPADAMQRPTALVFDLDPGAPATVVECCRVALLLHGMFDGLGLQSFVKTSGGKGLQVYVPLGGTRVTYERTKPFAKTVAELLEAEVPDLVVSRMTKARRAGRVLIDWSQNDARKTTVCVYSLRAGPLPSVSTPLEWDEVRAALDGGAEPRRGGGPGGVLSFQAADVLARVGERGDLFAPVLSLVQELPA